MSDAYLGHVPAYPKRQVGFPEYLGAVRREQRSTKTFVWIARGVEHAATVSYDCNGMAIGYEDNAECFLFE